MDRWSEAEVERFFWSFGQHLGTPGTQNPEGDLLGHVTDTGDAASDPLVRLYRTPDNINVHCDGADVVLAEDLACRSRRFAIRLQLL